MPKGKSITRLFEEGDAIDEALREAVEKALWQHVHARNPVYEDVGNGVVEVSPEELEARLRARQAERQAERQEKRRD